MWVDAVGEEDGTRLLTPEGPSGGKMMTGGRTEELALRIEKVAREERVLNLKWIRSMGDTPSLDLRRYSWRGFSIRIA